MSIDELKEYLDEYSKFLSNYNNSDLSIDSNSKNAILQITYECKTNKELGDFVTNLKKTSNYNLRNTMIDNYISNLEIKTAKNEKEIISKTFGVDITDIQHRMLNNDKDVFIFYDIKIGRNRILENLSNGESLTEQLKKIQNANENFQTDNYKENSIKMLDEQSKKIDCELDMIYIGDINRYEHLISKLEEKDLISFTKLIERKDELNIVYVNIENLLALDKDGKIYEAVYDDKKQNAVIEEPKEYSYNINEMSNKDKTENQDILSNDQDSNQFSEQSSNEQENDISYNDLEDIPDLIEAQLIEEKKDLSEVNTKEIAENVIKYYKNPDLMISLTSEEREFYERFVSMLAEKMELKNNKNRMNKVYKNEPNNYGFGNIIILTFIVIILIIILIIIIK